jgi:hypothetical protein
MNEKRNDRQQGGGMDKDRQGQQERKDEQRTPQKSGQVGGGGLGGGQKEGQERQGQQGGAMDRQRKTGRDIEEDVE